MLTEQQANELKRRHARHLLRLPNVSGVGVEKGEGGGYVVTLYLASGDEATRRQLPADLEGNVYKVVVTGPFTKH